jgi:hypothetical protein
MSSIKVLRLRDSNFSSTVLNETLSACVGILNSLQVENSLFYSRYLPIIHSFIQHFPVVLAQRNGDSLAENLSGRQDVLRIVESEVLTAATTRIFCILE